MICCWTSTLPRDPGVRFAVIHLFVVVAVVVEEEEEDTALHLNDTCCFVWMGGFSFRTSLM